MNQPKLKMGMIGGGTGAFIGAIHRIVSRMDNNIELVAGCFSSDVEKSKATAMQIGLADNRVYATYQEMLEAESQLAEDERIDFVSIVTPNHVHAAPAKLAIEKGIAVVLDKPLTHSYDVAKDLYDAWRKNPIPFAVTYTYAGYPLIQQARSMIKQGKLGKLRKVYVEYLQGWLSKPLEKEKNKQALWRTDISKSGKGGALGDIGCHAFHLAEFVTNRQVNALGSILETKVSGRQLDDDGMVWLDFSEGLSGMLIFSQIATGAENNIKIKVVGELGTLQWEHEKPNSLFFYTPEGSINEMRAGSNYTYLDKHISQLCRTPGGHPEGYLEAFANEYAMFVNQYIDWKNGVVDWCEKYPDLPNIVDGVRGMQFIEIAFEQNSSKEKWQKLL